MKLLLIPFLLSLLTINSENQTSNAMSEKNKQIVKDLYGKFHSKGDVDAWNKLISDDYVDHSMPNPQLPGNKEGLKMAVLGVRGAFPDVSTEIPHIIAEGNFVSVRVIATGTHKGEFANVPATNKEITWEEQHLYRLDDGQIVEHWGVFDMMSMMQQLGAF